MEESLKKRELEGWEAYNTVQAKGTIIYYLKRKIYEG